MTPEQSTPRPVESAEEEDLQYIHDCEHYLERTAFTSRSCDYLAGYAAARTALDLSERKAQRMEEALRDAVAHMERVQREIIQCRKAFPENGMSPTMEEYTIAPFRQLLNETQSAGEGREK